MTTTFAYPEAPVEHGRGGRVEGELKVSGQLMYADDLALPGLLYVGGGAEPLPARPHPLHQRRGCPQSPRCAPGADGRRRGRYPLRPRGLRRAHPGGGEGAVRWRDGGGGGRRERRDSRRGCRAGGRGVRPHACGIRRR